MEDKFAMRDWSKLGIKLSGSSWLKGIKCLLKKILFIYLFLERGGREGEREKH